jgi:hypothetical protein
MKTSYHLFTDKLLAPEGKLKDGQYSVMKQRLVEIGFVFRGKLRLIRRQFVFSKDRA